MPKNPYAQSMTGGTDISQSGLRIVTVHGTFAGQDYLGQDAAKTEFYSGASPFAKIVKSELPDAKWHEYTWSGKNLDTDRTKAAKGLRRYLKDLGIAPHEKVILLAHSHGGNVALEALRSAPLPNDIRLYSFGTPYIQKRSPGFLRLAGALIPNFIFFLAVLTIAALIGLGHAVYILYGIPFIDVAAGPEFNARMDSFNRVLAGPIAIALAVMAALWLLLWPMKHLFQNREFKYEDGFKLIKIRRTDDEAIALLSTDTQVSFPVGIFGTFFRFLAAAVFVIFTALSLRDGYQKLAHFRRTHEPGESWAQILPFGAEIIGLGLTLMLILLAAGFIIQKLFRRPLSWLLSLPMNSVLRKSGVGEDSYARLDVSHRPDIPPGFVTELTENNESLTHILAEVKAVSDRHLKENRTEIMRMMARGDGSVTDLMREGELTQSLIHCNYFTDDMAAFIAGHIQNADP